MHTVWLLLVGLLCLCVLSPVHAATYVVETSDDEIVTNQRCSLREAVRVASGLENNDCGLVNGNTPHTIQIDTNVVSTIYLLLDGGDSEDNSRTGDLDIGADMTIRGLNGRARIDGLARTRVFQIHNDATVSFENLEITNGHSVSGDSAGAITNSGAGAVTIRNCVFSDNRAEYQGSANVAGAVFANDAFVTVTDSTFERNEALTVDESAGAIWGGRSIVVTATKFEGNRCNGTVCGGAIGHLDHGVVNIEGGSFVDNRGGQGGAIYSGSGAVSLLGTEVRDNVAEDAGGAIWSLGRVTIDGGAGYAAATGNTAIDGNGGLAYSADSVHFRRVGGVTYNEAGGNGGAAWALYDVSFENIQGDVASNRARGYGGVAYSRYAAVEFYDVTGSIRENTGADGAVAYSADSSYIRSVGGSITGNSASNFGGVFMVTRPDTDTVIENVTGDVSYNTAASSGGVACIFGDRLLEITNVGSIHHNGAGFLGGVVYSERGGVSISQVHGDVAYNYAGSEGGVVYSDGGDGVSLRYVDGSVRSNTALAGGVVSFQNYESGVVDIGYIGGSIEFNVGVYAGGVVASRNDAQLHDIGGDVSNNRLATLEEFPFQDFGYFYNANYYVGYFQLFDLQGVGGAVFANGDVDVWNIKGDVADNSALAAGGGGFVFSLGNVSIRGMEGSIVRNQSFGSAVYAPFGDVRVSDVGGDISYNTSPVFLAGAYDNVLTLEYVGGDLVGNTCDLPEFQYRAYYAPIYYYFTRPALLQSAGIASGGFVSISHVGDIAYNQCVDGGVAYSTYGASITYAGDIHHNSGDFGGVLSTFGFGRIENVGNITHNSARFAGGVIWAGDAASLANVGNIEHNHTDGAGGVAFARFGGLQVDGTGSIRNNSASTGGVALLFNGTLDVRNVNGDISHNVANYFGGVFYVISPDSVATHDLADVSGDISYNSARGGGVFSVFGSSAYVRVSHTGAFRYNTANSDSGGVFYAQVFAGFSASLLMEYVGAIEHNSAERYGAVAYTDGHIDVLYVNGGISYNESFEGGVFDALQSVHAENVFGDINYNSSVRSVFYSEDLVAVQGVYGDVIGNLSGSYGALASGEFVSVDFVSGSIRRNTAQYAGGLMYSSSIAYTAFSRLTNVGGDIVGNTASYGGVIYSNSVGELTDVAGEIRNNRALFGYGGVVNAYHGCRVHRVGAVRYNSAIGSDVQGGAFSAYSVVISDVYGDIEGNVAGTVGDQANGGVAFGLDSVRVSNVHGSIRGNLALQYGGAFASLRSVDVSDVQGDLASNTAQVAGGAIYSGYAVIRNVSGDMRGNSVSIASRNTSGAGGGVAYAWSSLEVSDVGGSITDNSVFQYGGFGGAFAAGNTATLLRIGGDISYNRTIGSGGAVFAGDALQVSGVAGSIGWNRAAGDGGAFFSYSTVALSEVSGSVVHNGGGYGGVAYSSGPATVQNVGGSVSWNKATQSGGVLSSRDSELSNIGGSISGNRAGEFGGVLYNIYGSVVIENVEGSVEENIAFSGGVVYALNSSRVSLANVTGVISRNEATSYPSYGSGGVIYAFSTGIPSTVAVENVGEISNNYASNSGGFASVTGTQFSVRAVNGSIHRNNAGFFGGVVSTSVHDLSVEDVRGDIRENSAGSGGAIYNIGSNSRVVVRDVAGSINRNRAVYYAGGFILSFGSVLVDGVSGNVSTNSASSHGGVVFTNNDAITLQNVSGDVTYNTADEGAVFWSYNSVNIQNVGSFIGNYGRGESVKNAVVTGGYIVMQDVHGEISYNVGGFVSLGSLLLQRVDGSIHHNRNYDGGVAFANTTLEVFDVNGSICDNFATNAGGAFLAGYVRVANVAGDICNNTSGYAGGFLYAYISAEVSNVSGSLLFNQSPFVGGFAMAQEGITIKDIGGHIEGSQSYYGGFVFSPNGDVEIDTIGGGIVDCSAAQGGFAFATGLQLSNLGGSIDHCVASRQGGFAYLTPTSPQGLITLNGIYGSITNCNAYDGAVVYVTTMGDVEVDITNVTGDVSNNYSSGHYSYGSLVSILASYANVSIENVGGSITNNQAAYGGVIGLEGVGHVVIRNVSGLVSNNVAFHGYGGVIYAPSFVGELTDVEEGVCNNSAYLDGGVMFVYTGTVTTFNDGPVQFNSAYRYGGVIAAAGDALVDAGNGVVLGNTPDVVASFTGVENVQGSLVVDGVHTDALRIVSQPSDGVENVPLPGQPSLEVDGAMDGHELPIRVVVIHQDGSEDELTTDFNIAFEDRVHFQDLAIPFVENNLQLRFELIITRCDHIEETVVSNVTSTFFNVTECDFPAPAVCPDDVTVDNKQHECSAFVALPAAFSRKCSQPLISHTTTPVLDADRAVGEYPVGTTFVTYTLSNSLGVEDTCDVRVVVHDTEAPVITCPPATVVESDAGQCGATVTVSSPTVADNCDPDLLVITSTHPGTFYPVGVTEVTFRATDLSGNFAECSVEVQVVDAELPTIACPGDLIVGCDEIPNFQSPVGTDNCAGAVTRQLTGPPIASVLPLPPGVSTFEFEVLDASGERATCSFSVTTENDWYLDADGDGVGAISEPITQCPAPGPNYVADKNYDCDDTNAGLQVFLFPDVDEDGFGNSLLPICSSQAEADAASAASKKRSPDQVTLLVIGGDCDDTNPDINPNEIELCNGVDDNCNGVVDEGCDPPAAPPSLPTVPVIPLPPEPSLPSEQTIIIIPTPLPPAPPTPQQQIIIVQPAVFSDSGAASLTPSLAALLACVGAVMALLF